MSDETTPEADVFALLDKWDHLDSAINRVVTALPGQMTEAAVRLETERLQFRERIYKFTKAHAIGSSIRSSHE